MAQNINGASFEAASELKNNKSRGGDRPDFKGEGIAMWKHTDKNGEEFFKVKILGNILLRAFPNKESTATLSHSDLAIEEQQRQAAAAKKVVAGAEFNALDLNGGSSQ